MGGWERMAGFRISAWVMGRIVGSGFNDWIELAIIIKINIGD